MTFHRAYHDINQPPTVRNSINSVFTPEVASALSALGYASGLLVAQPDGTTGILVYCQNHSGGIMPPNTTGITGWSHWGYIANPYTPAAHGMFYPPNIVYQRLSAGKWDPIKLVNT